MERREAALDGTGAEHLLCLDRHRNASCPNCTKIAAVEEISDQPPCISVNNDRIWSCQRLQSPAQIGSVADQAVFLVADDDQARGNADPTFPTPGIVLRA